MQQTVYKYPKLKLLCGVLLLILSSNLLEASECYENGTSTSFQILRKNGGVYYQYTQKDRNGFSYVKQQNKLLKGIDPQTFKVLGEDERTFMVGDKNGFYVIPKLEQYEEHGAVYFKILNANAHQKQINGRLFLINGKWTYFNAWAKDITKMVLNELPQKISNIKSYSNGFYVKSDKNVFVISIDEASLPNYKISIVPGLNPATTVYYAGKELNNEDFLADATHFFSIRREGSIDDLTPQLMALGLKTNMNKLTLSRGDIPIWFLNGRMLKKREGTSSEGTNPVTGDAIDIDYSFTAAQVLKPLFGGNRYTLFRNKIYPVWDDNFSQPYDLKTDPGTLKAIEDKLFRGDDFYYSEADDDFKIISTKIPADAKFFPSVNSYLSYLPKALVDDEYIHFIGDRFNIDLDNKKKLTSKIVKQLGMFYMFNHTLYDGNKTYPIIADEKTLTYLGSFVEIVNGCSDSMPNSPQVNVKYHNFFKDKNHVYYLDNQKYQLQIIQTAGVENTRADDYETMQALYKIRDVKGSVKNKKSAQANYYLIFGSSFLVLGLGIYLLTRKT